MTKTTASRTDSCRRRCSQQCRSTPRTTIVRWSTSAHGNSASDSDSATEPLAAPLLIPLSASILFFSFRVSLSSIASLLFHRLFDTESVHSSPSPSLISSAVSDRLGPIHSDPLVLVKILSLHSSCLASVYPWIVLMRRYR
jgi:hypothetical protein